MNSWFRRLFQPASSREKSSRDSEIELRSEIGRLRLDLAEREKEIARLRGDLSRAQEQLDRRVAAEVDQFTARLLEDLAPLISQAALQRHLVETEQKELQPIDLLSVPRRMEQILMKYGLETFGDSGKTAPFDPSRHLPLSASETIPVGQPVRIRFIGIGYQGKILRKAGVESVEFKS